MNCPSADTSRFNLYIEAAKSVVDYKSNALYLDLFRNNIVIWLINKRIQAIREENIDFF